MSQNLNAPCDFTSKVTPRTVEALSATTLRIPSFLQVCKRTILSIPTVLHNV